MEDWFYWCNIMLAIMIIFFTWTFFIDFRIVLTVFASAIIFLHVFYAAREKSRR